MPYHLTRARATELWRYYQAGVVNTLFGAGAYTLLVWLGINMYAAQLLAHTAGVAFNYASYSRHVFREAAPAKLRFALSYVVNYLMSLATLAAAALVVSNPYVAGLISVGAVSVVNYFILKHLIFVRRSA